MQGTRVQQINNLTITKNVIGGPSQKDKKTVYYIYNPYGVQIGTAYSLTQAKNMCENCYAYTTKPNTLSNEFILSALKEAYGAYFSTYKAIITTKANSQTLKLNIYGDDRPDFTVETRINDTVEISIIDSVAVGTVTPIAKMNVPKNTVINKQSLYNLCAWIDSTVKSAPSTRAMVIGNYLETNLQNYFDGRVISFLISKPLLDGGEPTYGEAERNGYVIFFKFGKTDVDVSDKAMWTENLANVFSDNKNLTKWDGFSIVIFVNDKNKVACGYRYWNQVDATTHYSQLKILDNDLTTQEVGMLPKALSDKFLRVLLTDSNREWLAANGYTFGGANVFDNTPYLAKTPQ